MGIFKSITKTLKKAAPLIGASIGMYFGGPMGSAALGGALGGGIGSLVGGGDADDALKAALLGGIGGYASAGGNFTTAGQTAANAGNVASTATNMGGQQGPGFTSVPSAPPAEPSMFGKVLGFAKENPYLTAAGVGSLGLLGSLEEPQATGNKMREYSEGQYRGGILTTLDDDGNPVNFDGADPEQRKAYRDQLARNQRRKKEVVTDYDEYGMFTAANGGLVKGYNAGGYANSTLGDLYRLSNDIGFSEGEQRNIQSALDKRIGGRTGFDALPTKQLIANTSSSGKEGYTEADIREMSGILAKRSAPKIPMMDSSMNDPSQLMRNFMVGGEVRGSGSGTSDSVPARLSDGEFVVTAKAVRGAGGGDRNVGAARMYDMMSQLERVA